MSIQNEKSQSEKADNIFDSREFRHEFKNIMASALGYTELLLDMELDPEKHSYLAEIRGSILRSSELIKHVYEKITK